MNRVHKAIRSFGLPQPSHHLRRAPERSDRVRNPLARDVGRAAVDRLEQARASPRRVQAARRGHPDAPRERRRQVRQDVAVEVGRHDGVQALRPQHHPDRHGVHQHLVRLDLRVLRRELAEDLVPEHHAVPLRVALGHHGEFAPRPRCGRLEGKAHRALDARPREDGDVGRDGEWCVVVRCPALSCVLSLAVFTYHDPIQRSVLEVLEGGAQAGEQSDRSNVHVLV